MEEMTSIQNKLPRKKLAGHLIKYLYISHPFRTDSRIYLSASGIPFTFIFSASQFSNLPPILKESTPNSVISVKCAPYSKWGVRQISHPISKLGEKV